MLACLLGDHGGDCYGEDGMPLPGHPEQPCNHLPFLLSPLIISIYMHA